MMDGRLYLEREAGGHKMPFPVFLSASPLLELLLNTNHVNRQQGVHQVIKLQAVTVGMVGSE
jgi:hypothetical protein